MIITITTSLNKNKIETIQYSHAIKKKEKKTDENNHTPI